VICLKNEKSIFNHPCHKTKKKSKLGPLFMCSFGTYDTEAHVEVRNCHRVYRVPGFLSSLQNWLPPPPHPPASVAPPPLVPGGTHSLAGEGVGEPIRTKGRTIWYSSYSITSGFWPRVRAHALRAPVFLGLITCQTGRCATPPPQRSLAASYLPPHTFP
jgi:hypothetical protein